jgi:hypothetical protein
MEDREPRGVKHAFRAKGVAGEPLGADPNRAQCLPPLMSSLVLQMLHRLSVLLGKEQLFWDEFWRVMAERAACLT